jgi:anti-sigma factor RsiW
MRMFPDRLSRLLTAYIDGEMTPRQRKNVLRLLERSPEARAMLSRLQEDAGNLRALPRRQLPPDFSSQVLRSIVERRLGHARRWNQQGEPVYHGWAGLAAVASVLIAVGFGSYLYFAAATSEDNGTGAFVDKGPTVPVTQPKHVDAASSGAVAPTNPASPRVEPKKEPSSAPAPSAVVKGDSKPESPGAAVPAKPANEPGKDPVLGVQKPKAVDLETVESRLALSLALRELDKEDTQQRLLKELHRETAYRLELFSLGNGKAMERVQAAFQARGIRLLIDAEAQVRLQNRRLRADYALYVEGLRAEELSQVLRQLRADDKRAEGKRKGDSQFDKMLILPLTAPDRKELINLLGVDPAQLPLSKPTTPLGVDPRKPVSDKTAEQVVQALEGKGPSRPEPGATAAIKPGERVALVLSYNPPRPKGAPSKQLKQFVDHLKARSPGTVQMLLVLRRANG